MSRQTIDSQWLENLKRKAHDLFAEENTVVDGIRSGFVNRVVVFIDLAGSTSFKIEHKGSPEKWILLFRQFSKLVSAAVQGSHGNVVKFIGDEVMATFENVEHAVNFLTHAPEIGAALYSATGVQMPMKIAADFGPVYELHFEGHEAPDPQGIIVDRCAGISKYGVPGEVLASAYLVGVTPTLDWFAVGEIEVHAVGRVAVYQLGGNTANLEPRVEISRKEYVSLKEERDRLREELERFGGSHR
ncbi:hypothetical protein [Desulfonatronum parangueonense]